MNLGTENRKQLILAGTLGVAAVGALLYTFAGGSGDTSAPVPLKAPVSRNAAGPVTAKVSRSALDPTLHPEGMHLAESLRYSGSGRNIFSTSSVVESAGNIPKAIAGPRMRAVSQRVNPGPPPPPPIDLRFFGTATRANGRKQAFFLRGDDVFLAAEGDIVGRRYKIGPILATSVEVTDLTNNNRQRLPLAMQ